MSAHCALPAAIQHLESEIEGGWTAIMEHNHNLAIRGRDILCEALGLEKPCPDDMIACIATLILPSTSQEGGIPLHEPDPLHTVLSDKYGIQIPVWSWASPRGRYIRLSAQLYNSEEEYRYLAWALQQEGVV